MGLTSACGSRLKLSHEETKQVGVDTCHVDVSVCGVSRLPHQRSDYSPQRRRRDRNRVSRRRTQGRKKKQPRFFSLYHDVSTEVLKQDDAIEVGQYGINGVKKCIATCPPVAPQIVGDE
ncbi:Uncharacterized protein Fot_26375 [Forsythia ovata]|uniref:Uncharacterized protein n=1 Tax=Forsythia ovata TaxID=205694 RepID=A0ABD1UBT0_9LAMI